MWLIAVVGGDLVDQLPVAAHVCQVVWNWKLLDGLDMLGEGLRLVFGEPDASPVHGVFPKPELEGALQVGGVIPADFYGLGLQDL